MSASLIGKIKKYIEARDPAIRLSLVAYPFENDEGSFVGYYGYNKHLDLFFRLSFYLFRKNDIVHHIDYFELGIFNEEPTYTIYPDEVSLDNIFNLISNPDDGVVDEDETGGVTDPMYENVSDARKEQLFRLWVEKDAKARDIDFLGSKKVEDIYKYFIKQDEKYNSEVPLSWFRARFKTHAASVGLVVKRGRKSGGKRERDIENPQRQLELITKKEAFGYQKNIEVLEKYILGIFDKKLRGLIVYGPPGVGKTETLHRTIDNLIEERDLTEGIDYVVFSGGTKDISGLLSILKKHGGADGSEPKIIIFDDFSIPKDSQTIEVLAKALDFNARTPPYITAPTGEKGLNAWHDAVAEVYQIVGDWASAQKKATGKAPSKNQRDKKAEDLLNNTPKYKKLMPPSFYYDGRIIIITNDINVDPKLLSRTLKILIDPTNKEILDTIRSDDFETGFDDPRAKRTIIKALEYISEGVKRIDFRTYQKAVALYTLLIDMGEDVFLSKLIDDVLLGDDQ